MEQIKITNLRSHMQVEWPGGTVHTWFPMPGRDAWHTLANRIADVVPECYSTEPVEAGGSQYEPEGGLVAFCDLHGVVISYGLGMWTVTKNDEIVAYGNDLEMVLKTAEKEMVK